MHSDLEGRMLDFITDSIAENGYAPSVRDIQNALSIKSTSTVFAYLRRLEEKGHIIREDGKSRSIRVDGAARPGRQVPIIGRVRAGMPILAEENLEGYVDFLTDKYRSSALFALRVTGNSMIEAGILDGDTVIVEQTNVAEEGEIIVALIDDEATVKEFYKEGNGVFRLQPRNASLSPIYTKELVILGRVVASIRYY